MAADLLSIIADCDMATPFIVNLNIPRIIPLSNWQKFSHITYGAHPCKAVGACLNCCVMGSSQKQANGDMGPASSLSEYYSALTDLAVNHPADLLAIHYGLWGPDTKSDEEALLRANQTLVRGCNLGPGQQVLDAGCGVGGMAIWLAKEYDVHVIGLTNCEPHVGLAMEQAEQRGVGHLVEFRYGDFMEMPFPNAWFDAVLNHETYCYAPDKLTYLQGVRRVLKPGGRWQAVDGFLGDKLLSESEETIHAGMQRGWHTPPLERWRDVLATLEIAGFEKIGEQNLDSEVAPATERLCRVWNLFGDLFTPPSQSWAYKEFRDGVFNYHEGLRQGVFSYRLIFGVKPA